MSGIALVARLGLAVVFGVAAAGKLLDQAGARRALADFGVPERARAPGALLLPLAEIAVAVALVPRASARWGAVAALCLLVVFMAAIAWVMRRGETPDCGCFGTRASAPVGRGTLVRNALLAAPAVLVVAYGPGGGGGIDGWVSARSTAELVAVGAGVCTVVLAVALARLWPENRRLRRDLERAHTALAPFQPGLPVGAPAPKFSVRAADGARTDLDALLGRGLPVALVFVTPGCSPCAAMFPDLTRWQQTLAERITIALLSTGTVGENRALAERYGLADVLVQDDGEVLETYRVPATPSVVIVAPDARIGSRTHSAQPLIEATIRDALHDDRAATPALRTVTANGRR